MCEHNKLNSVEEMFALSYHIIQIYSGNTRGRVLNRELYTQRLQKLIYLYLSANCFIIVPRIGERSS